MTLVARMNAFDTKDVLKFILMAIILISALSLLVIISTDVPPSIIISTCGCLDPFLWESP